MRQIEAVETHSFHIQPALVRCRFAMLATDTPLSHEFCVFDFPGCEGGEAALHPVRSVGDSQDPIKSKTWQGWIAGASRPAQ